MTTLSEKYAWNIATDADRALTDAAPELLEALKNLLIVLDEKVKPYALPTECRRRIAGHEKPAREAIAKAEGR